MLNRRERFLMKDGNHGRRTGDRCGFTLVELLVVVSIIALLVAILVPSLSGVRTQAKMAAAKALITSLDAGLNSFKQESALGGVYPPSAPDDPANPGQIADPIFSDDSTGSLDHTTGASLLVYALNGADQLGTPGFVNRGVGVSDGWADDFGWSPADIDDPPVGAYATDSSTRDPLVPRYGPYADTLTKDVWSLNDLIDQNRIDDPGWTAPQDYKHRVFVDRWGQPILYYRARAAARAIVPTATTPVGVYDPSDNAYLTGGWDADGTPINDSERLRLGGLPKTHALANVQASQGNGLEPGDDPRKLDRQSAQWDGTYLNSFELFIWDDKSTARIAPVNRRSFVLISAGPDHVWGTNDDVTNFERQ